MIQIDKVQPGDTLEWLGKCGKIRGTVKRIANGCLCAFTDEIHCLPIEALCACPGPVLIEGQRDNKEPLQSVEAAPAQKFNSISEAPVLF